MSIFMLASCFSFAALPPNRVHNVTQVEAEEKILDEFKNQDVNIFKKEEFLPSLILNGGAESSKWTFFVDPEPMKGWMHDAYIVEIPKKIISETPIKFWTLADIPLTKRLTSELPTDDYTPLVVSNRYGVNADAKPSVMGGLMPNAPDNYAQRTYAVIINGGASKMANKPRYWNDCSFIYQTLSKKYGVPKDQIYPIMADGNDPADDSLLGAGRYYNQSLDLDFDGNDEIKLAATKANIKSTLENLASVLVEDDHLFIFVTDHGGTIDRVKTSFICLWNSERLYDYELAELLKPFTAKYVNVNVVLGQCYSGGFVDDLDQIGCVVATASRGSEYSYGMYYLPYDEFLYHWICAVNGADPQGQPLNADTNGDGFVSMDEAFSYARLHDAIEEETPQYQSRPLSVGEDLAFNRMAPAVDLYIKDNPEDTGKQPNLTTDKFWCSPSIWVRNQDDGIEQHENPYYSSDHLTSMVYVRVHNRGKKDYEGGQWAHVYWAKASTGFTDAAWKGRELYHNRVVTGEHLRASHIPPIASDASGVVKITWSLPNDLIGGTEDNNTENHHFCLLGKIMDTHLDDGYEAGKRYFNVKGSNKQAQKNVSVIKRDELSKETKVYVRNVSSSAQNYSLELVPRTSADAELFDNASIQMSMSQAIYKAWENGGLQADNISIPLDMANAPGKRHVSFQSQDGILSAIRLSPDEFDEVSLKFNFRNGLIREDAYVIDLIQRDENGNIVGGETFEVEAPYLVLNPGTLIEETPPAIKFVGYGSPAKHSLTVSLESEAPMEGSIVIASVIDGKVIGQTPIAKGEAEVNIDISGLAEGVYSATYVSNGVVADNRRFYK